MTTFCMIMRCWNIFLTDLDWKSMSKEETATFEMMWKSIFIYTMVMHVNSMQPPVLWIRIWERHWLRHINKRHQNNHNAQQQDFQISLLRLHAFTKHLQFHRREISKLLVVTRKMWIKWKIRVMLLKQLTADWEVKRAVKTYVNVTLNWGAAFGCFAMMKYELLQDVWYGLLSLYRNCCTAMHFTQNNHTVSVLTGLKSNRTYYNRTIIHVDEWKQSKNPLQVLLIEQLANKPRVLAQCICFIYLLLFKQPIMFPWRPPEGNFHLFYSCFNCSKQGHTCRLIHKLLPSSFAPGSAPFQMRWMLSVVTYWSSSGWAIFSWGPRL